MKRTRKWAFVAQEATRLASLGLSPREIGKRLGVDRSTVTRWMRSGKLSRAGTRVGPAPLRPEQTPAEWAKAIRAAYDLDDTDGQLIALAESALSIAIDPLAPGPVRLNAAGRYQAIVRQLALVARHVDQAQPIPDAPAQPTTAARTVRPRSSVDPRTALMLVAK